MGIFGKKGEQITINVQGMSCDHCVKAVTAAAKGVSGVTNVKVDLKAGTAQVVYDGTDPTLAAVKAAINAQGFTAA
jgi:copper chaperone